MMRIGCSYHKQTAAKFSRLRQRRKRRAVLSLTKTGEVRPARRLDITSSTARSHHNAREFVHVSYIPTSAAAAAGKGGSGRASSARHPWAGRPVAGG